MYDSAKTKRPEPAHLPVTGSVMAWTSLILQSHTALHEEYYHAVTEFVSRLTLPEAGDTF